MLLHKSDKFIVYRCHITVSKLKWHAKVQYLCEGDTKKFFFLYERKILIMELFCSLFISEY